MNPRQRRGVLLLVLAALGLIGVFAAVGVFVAGVREQVDPKVTVLALTEDSTIDQPITPDMVEEIEVPERWASQSALDSTVSLADTVASSNYPAGTQLQQGMVQPDDEAGPREREISILVDAETGVAGRVQAGDRVDILASFAETDRRPPQTRVVVADAQVIALGVATQVQGQTTGGTVTTEEVVPITFALEPKEALAVTYAESFAEEVRLGQIGLGGAPPIPQDERILELTDGGAEYAGSGGDG